MKQIILIIHNIRSSHNVGSLLRTAEGLGVEKVFLTGYTPYPALLHDERLPHIAARTGRQISKTALGAEDTLAWEYTPDIDLVINNVKKRGFEVIGLEQTTQSIPLPKLHAPDRIALVIGNEVTGIEKEVLKFCTLSVEIPMFGRKESFNVVQATAMALYHCRFRE